MWYTDRFLVTIDLTRIRLIFWLFFLSSLVLFVFLSSPGSLQRKFWSVVNLQRERYLLKILCTSFSSSGQDLFGKSHWSPWRDIYQCYVWQQSIWILIQNSCVTLESGLFHLSFSLFRQVILCSEAFILEETILIQWPPLTPFGEWHPASVNFLAIFFKKYLVVSWRPRSLFCSRVNCLIFFVKFTLCFLFVFWSRTWVNELTLRH